MFVCTNTESYFWDSTQHAAHIFHPPPKGAIQKGDPTRKSSKSHGWEEQNLTLPQREPIPSLWRDKHDIERERERYIYIYIYIYIYTHMHTHTIMHYSTSVCKVWSYPAIKGLRPPQHHAGEFHPHHTKTSSESDKQTNYSLLVPKADMRQGFWK